MVESVPIIMLIHVFLISLTLAPTMSFCNREIDGMKNRWVYLNMSVWSGFFLTMTLVASEIFAEVSCWIYLVTIFISPSLVILPYFLMTTEYWSAEKNEKTKCSFYCCCCSKWFNKKGGWTINTSLKALCLFVGIHFLVAVICLALRYKAEGYKVLFDQCILGPEMAFLVVDFAVYILIFVVCLFLQKKTSVSTWLIFKEQNLIAIWSILTLGTFFCISFNRDWYEKFNSKLFNSNILILMFDLGPVLFSLIPSTISFALSVKVGKSGHRIRVTNGFLRLFNYRRGGVYQALQQQEGEDSSEEYDMLERNERDGEEEQATIFSDDDGKDGLTHLSVPEEEDLGTSDADKGKKGKAK